VTRASNGSSGPRARCSSRTVQATREELSRAQDDGGEVASYGCLAAITGGVGWTLWGVAGWIGSWFGEGARRTGNWVGLIGAVVFMGYITLVVSRHIGRRRKLRNSDANQGLVEELEVTTGRVMELNSDHSSTDPAVCFDLGEGRLLLLVGQWQWEPRIFGVPDGEEPESTDEINETVPNQLPAPWSFPSDSFVLRRLPVSGEVLSVEVRGAFVKPEKGTAWLTAAEGRDFHESMILKGTLDDVETALKQVRAGK